MWKKLMSIIGLLLLGACGVSTQHNTTNDKVELVLDWTPNTNHTGIYTAIEKGYFQEVGIDLTVVQPPEDGAELLVGSHRAQFGISFQDTLASSFVQNIPVTAIAAILQHNTSGILSLKEKNITSPKQLMDHNYATWNLPIEQAILQKSVELDGGAFSRVEKIPNTVTDIISALSTTIDSVWVYEGWDKVAADNYGLETNYWAFKDIHPVFDYYTPVLIANNEVIAQNPDLVKRFMSAITKGYQYSAQNPEESAKILLKYAPELDEKLVINSQKIVSTYYVDEGVPFGYIDPTRWNNFYEWLNENNLVDGVLETDKGFTNEFITR